jgi:hypothetical protein
MADWPSWRAGSFNKRLMPGGTLTRIPNLVNESGPPSSRREKNTILPDYGTIGMCGSLPIAQADDSRYDRQNIKIGLESRVSEHLNHLKRLNGSADSSLKLD